MKKGYRPAVKLPHIPEIECAQKVCLPRVVGLKQPELCPKRRMHLFELRERDTGGDACGVDAVVV